MADYYNNVIRQINFNTNTVVTIAGSGSASYGDGAGNIASLSGPTSVYVNDAGSIMYVADADNKRIRQISCTSGIYF